MSKKFNWPLTTSPFTVWDKLKIGAFLFWEPMWTYGKWVREYEKLWEKEFGVKHAIMVSSGSTANEMIALRRKWELQQAGEWPRRNKVIFPVNTWISSVSPFLNIGFEPVFVDVDKNNLNVGPDTIHRTLKNDKDKSIGTVFYTALLGYFNDLDGCQLACQEHGAKFLMDNCEASFSYHSARGSDGFTDLKGSPEPIIRFVTNSTSIFFSHFTMSGTEGGLVFTNDDEEADWYRMARSHGLTRGMPDKYKNPNVNADFDFYLLGSNYRSSNLQAYMAMLDFKRAIKFSRNNRRQVMSALTELLDPEKYQAFRSSFYDYNTNDFVNSIPLALPILCKTRDQRIRVETYLKTHGVMCRPLIAGCLLAHTAFKGYGNIDDFPVAKWSHECCLYIGLNDKVTLKMARELAIELNKL